MLSGRRYRQGALIAGAGAAAAMVVLGACTTLTGGTVRVDGADAPAYRTSMSASAADSAVTSAMREAERQQTVTTEAIHTACETLSTTSADAVGTLNDYVSAALGEGGTAVIADPSAVAPDPGPAADALRQSADLVDLDINDALPQHIRDALTAWSAAARAAATALTDRVPADQFNEAVIRVNDSRSRALDLCDATY